MSAGGPVAWEAEASADAAVSPAAAFRYWTALENWADDEGVERAEIDGPFRPGARGRTHLAGGGLTEWTVVEVDEGRAATVESSLGKAAIRFTLRFEEAGSGCRLTQRVQLRGEAAPGVVEGVREGFGPPALERGMRALARRIERACGTGGPR